MGTNKDTSNMSIEDDESNKICENRKPRRRSSVLMQRISYVDVKTASRQKVTDGKEESKNSVNTFSLEEYIEKLTREKEEWGKEKSTRRQKKKKTHEELVKQPVISWESCKDVLTKEDIAFQETRPDYEEISRAFDKLTRKIQIHARVWSKVRQEMPKLLERYSDNMDMVQADICDFFRSE